MGTEPGLCACHTNVAHMNCRSMITLEYNGPRVQAEGSEDSQFAEADVEPMSEVKTQISCTSSRVMEVVWRVIESSSYNRWRDRIRGSEKSGESESGEHTSLEVGVGVKFGPSETDGEMTSSFWDLMARGLLGSLPNTPGDHPRSERMQ